MRALASAAIALVLASTQALAQGITNAGVTTATSCQEVAGARSCSFEIRISGAITASTPDEIKQAFAERDAMMEREGRQNDWLSIHIDSGGGNVPAAIVVGRLLRAMDAPIEIDPDATCASACVLVFAGATHRLMFGRLGIHRPYFETPTTDFAVSDVQRWYDALSTETRSYLREMNVSERLADDLMAVPPEQMHYLTAAELVAYGLDIVDPVTREAADLQEARRLGLDRATYLQRKLAAESFCRVVDPRDLATIRLSRECMNAVLAGRHVERAPPCRNRAVTCETAQRQWRGKRLGPNDQVTGDGFLISAE